MSYLGKPYELSDVVRFTRVPMVVIGVGDLGTSSFCLGRPIFAVPLDFLKAKGKRPCFDGCVGTVSLMRRLVDQCRDVAIFDGNGPYGPQICGSYDLGLSARQLGFLKKRLNPGSWFERNDIGHVVKGNFFGERTGTATPLVTCECEKGQMQNCWSASEVFTRPRRDIHADIHLGLAVRHPRMGRT